MPFYADTAGFEADNQEELGELGEGGGKWKWARAGSSLVRFWEKGDPFHLPPPREKHSWETDVISGEEEEEEGCVQRLKWAEEEEGEEAGCESWVLLLKRGRVGI